VKRSKRLPKKNPHTGSWVEKKPRLGFRGYPVATLAFYGPTDKLATKVVASIIVAENQPPDPLRRWFSDGGLDARLDPEIGDQVLAFLAVHSPRSTVVADRIIGCPHEEGIDYPEGTSCPQCPYWAGRDRFTHERVQ